jgi:hypothetical protein
MNGNTPLLPRRAGFQTACAALTAMILAMPASFAQESTYTKTVPSKPAAPAAPAPAPAAQPAPPAPAPAPATQAAPAQPPIPTQQTQAAAPQPNPLGAGWSTKFGTTPPPESGEFKNTPEQVAIVTKLNNYFNNMINLEGTFLQTDADD